MAEQADAESPDAAQAWLAELEASAVSASGALDLTDWDAAVDAAAAAAARRAGCPGGGARREVVGELAGAASAVAELADGWALPQLPTVDWSGFGLVVPVLAGSAGAGASVVAAVLADAVAAAGWPVGLVDAADPARSGLAAVTEVEGSAVVEVHPRLRVRHSWRDPVPTDRRGVGGPVVVSRLETDLAAVIPGMVPPPPLWCPPEQLWETAPEATVVDLGHDGWRCAANPLAGAGAWLREGHPPPAPVLVVRPSRPSLRQAEQVLARLEPWVDAELAAPVEALIVVGATRWPRGVAGAAGVRLAPLIDAAVFVPHDDHVAVTGVDPGPLPRRLLTAVEPLLQQWSLLDEDAGSGAGMVRRLRGAGGRGRRNR